jgi:cephalosporin hydroxylase
MTSGHRTKGAIVRFLRRASTNATYRRLGAAAVRSNPSRLLQFTRCTVMFPAQHREEFLPFLELLASDPPSTLLEIGTSRGGTFFMMCQVADADARLATLDLHLPTDVRVETFARSGQHVTGIEGNSTDPEIRTRVDALFPEGLDVLFIDGDHSYEGVKSDFELYRSLVRPGGLVVFHDIVPDDEERTGTPTMSWSGGVPRFWRELKGDNQGDWKLEEFVRSWDQDGFGIGIARKMVRIQNQRPMEE